MQTQSHTVTNTHVPGSEGIVNVDLEMNDLSLLRRNRNYIKFISKKWLSYTSPV